MFHWHCLSRFPLPDSQLELIQCNLSVLFCLVQSYVSVYYCRAIFLITLPQLLFLWTHCHNCHRERRQVLDFRFANNLLFVKVADVTFPFLREGKTVVDLFHGNNSREDSNLRRDVRKGLNMTDFNFNEEPKRLTERKCCFWPMSGNWVELFCISIRRADTHNKEGRQKYIYFPWMVCEGPVYVHMQNVICQLRLCGVATDEYWTAVRIEFEAVRFKVPGTRTGFLPRSNSIGEGTRFSTQDPKSNSLVIGCARIMRTRIDPSRRDQCADSRIDRWNTSSGTSA